VISFRVSGDYACFSRPEFKVERVSYPILTPSAARGIAEAVFWRPEFRYEIRRIGVINRGGTTVIVRNEISDRQGKTPLIVEDQRQQRSSLVLKDVDYIVEGMIVLRPHATDPAAKYLSQFERRIERGQHFHSPYLGTREFSAKVTEVGDARPSDLTEFAVGNLLFDIAFVPDARRDEMSFRVPGREHPVSGFAQAVFMEEARVQGGWLNIPSAKYQEVYRLEAGRV
jgi:CRISPR-associated protein Cas5d